MKRFVTRRLVFLAMIPIVLLATLYIWLLTWPNSSSITKVNFDKIEPGMSKLELEHLLDAPHFVYEEFGIEFDFDCFPLALLYTEGGPDRFPPSDTIWIEFGEKGQVIAKRYARPTVGEYWKHLLARLSLAVNRSQPRPAPSPLAVSFRMDPVIFPRHIFPADPRFEYHPPGLDADGLKQEP